MQHGTDNAVKFSSKKMSKEDFLVEIIRDFAIDEVSELLRVLEIINCNDSRHSAFIECLDYIRTNKSGCASNDGIHGGFLSGRVLVILDQGWLILRNDLLSVSGFFSK